MASIALTIAGSDSGGGAGVQADMKAMSALGVYAASAVTAITAQNTRGVFAVEDLSAKIVASQIRAVLDDFAVGAVKIGMLSSSTLVETVADALAGYDGPVVLDPVMVAKSGDALLRDDAVAALTRRLLPRASVLTPNLPEAARLLGGDQAETDDEMLDQGEALRALGPRAVLMKGGHGAGDDCVDFLVSTGAPAVAFRARRIATKNTHGTGCTLSSAIAAGLAKGLDLTQATGEAHAYLQAAIAQADALAVGGGAGPVHHFHAHWAP
ncbi:MAG: bifunctional hydroxymethylpyrimidine kinase/phosphomethylpyrimidine kinase [Pseudomonadota bacterium]